MRREMIILSLSLKPGLINLLSLWEQIVITGGGGGGGEQCVCLNPRQDKKVSQAHK